MPDARTKTCEDNASATRVAWFVTLERARDVQDYERAAEALRQLKRLGITIKFRRLTTKSKAAGEQEDTGSSARVAESGVAP